MTSPVPPMVERVARAIWERRTRNLDQWPEFFAWYLAGAGNPASSVHRSTLAEALHDAHAALSALREPTEAMVDAGWKAYADLERVGQVSDVGISAAFSAAIDAALSEPDQTGEGR